jgi:hypothetical protein
VNVTLQVQSTGVTRTDVLEGREVQQRRRFRGSTGDFDTIDRIVEQPEVVETQAPDPKTPSSMPLDRCILEASICCSHVRLTGVAAAHGACRSCRSCGLG